MEEWRDIPGYEGQYQASTEGNIKSLSRKIRVVNPYTRRPFMRSVPERILKPGKYCKSGHISVVLGHGLHGRPVHQLIAQTFIGDCPAGMEVLHINGDPADNRVLNLRYGTRTENILDVYSLGKPWRKLTTDDVLAIRQGLERGEKGAKLSKDFCVSETTISRIKRGRSFAWLPDSFTF